MSKEYSVRWRDHDERIAPLAPALQSILRADRECLQAHGSATTKEKKKQKQQQEEEKEEQGKGTAEKKAAGDANEPAKKKKKKKKKKDDSSSSSSSGDNAAYPLDVIIDALLARTTRSR